MFLPAKIFIFHYITMFSAQHDTLISAQCPRLQAYGFLKGTLLYLELLVLEENSQSLHIKLRSPASLV